MELMTAAPPPPFPKESGADSAALAAGWYEVLAVAHFTHQDVAETQGRLLKLAHILLELLANDPLDWERARRIGGALVPLCQERPQALARTQRYLTHALLDPLSPAEQLALHPHLAALLSEIGVGFLEAQAYEVRSVSRSLLTRMGHDLRGSLNIIIGFSRLVLKGMSGPLTDLQESDLRAVYNEGKVLQERIDALLDLTKLETGLMEVRPQPFEVVNLLEELRESFQPRILQNDNELVLQYPPDLGTLHADPIRLEQVLGCLLNNSAKFTVQGVVRLAAWVEPRDDGLWYTFEVSDTGIGLAPSRLALLGSKSSSALPTGHADSPGGNLWMSRRLCELMGGTFQAASQVGRGSTFTLRLPAQPKR